MTNNDDQQQHTKKRLLKWWKIVKKKEIKTIVSTLLKGKRTPWLVQKEKCVVPRSIRGAG